MNIGRTRLTALFALAIVSGCSGGAPQQAVSANTSSSQLVRASDSSRTTSQVQAASGALQTTDAAKELPVLNNPSGFLGEPVPGGVTAGRKIGLPALEYPQNDDAASMSKFKPSLTLVPQIASMPREAGFAAQATTLKHFSESVFAAKSGFIALKISPKRMVYEVAGTFATPYRSAGGVVYSSGQRLYLFDAASGDLLGVATGGTKTATPNFSSAPGI